MKSGEAAAVPLLLKNLIQADDAAALLATAKAYEQTSDQTRALAAYRRLYFFAPASAESADAATAITRLGSTASPATTEEAITRADRLYAGKKYTDALTAYGDAFAKFPAYRNQPESTSPRHRCLQCAKTPDAVAALTAFRLQPEKSRGSDFISRANLRARKAMGTSACDCRRNAQEFFQTATSRRAHLSPSARLRRTQTTRPTLPTSCARQLTAISSSLEVAQAQFDLAWEAARGEELRRIVANAHRASRALRR